MIKLRFFIPLLFLYAVTASSQPVWDGSVAGSYAGGDGSSESPYLISNAGELAKLVADVYSGINWSEGKYFKLTADIILNENVVKDNFGLNRDYTFTEWPMVGYYNSESDYQAFMGVLDGDGFVIRGVLVNSTNYNQVGFFRVLENATVKNLGFIDSYLYSNAYVGTITGLAINSTIVNCFTTGRVGGSGSYHGGIAGQISNESIIANCYSSGYVSGKNAVGGILGRNGVLTDSVFVENCYNSAVVYAVETVKAGLVADNRGGGVVRNSYYLDTLVTTGVYSNTGRIDGVEVKTNAEMRADPFLDLLNENSKEVPYACRWINDYGFPTHNYTIFTPGNKPDYSKIATGPVPADGDLHADADSGKIVLQWKPAVNGRTVRHYLYFSEDYASLAAISETDTLLSIASLPLSDTSFTIENIRKKMTDYYWRVDQRDNEDTISMGEIWSFRTRQQAFPGAEGYGRYAIGGRGGQVVYVTNLDNSGPGSFRDAVENVKGPRTILFAVSGLITLESRLNITDNFITIAGQSAPGKGICFRWAPVGVTGDNIIVQYLRVRLGLGITYDGMGLTGANHSIIDHCSVSWTIDEAVSSRYANSITLQRTLISEALNAADHSNYDPGTEHGYAGSIGGDIGSFHHNLLAHCNGRNWSMAGGLDANNDYAGRLDLFNNVVYNWGSRTTDGGAHEVNFVNNYYKKGAASTISTMLTAQLEGMGGGTQSYFYSGNILENKDGSLACDGTDNTCATTYVLTNGQELDWDVYVDEPFFPSQATIHPAADAYKLVLSDVGCNQPVFDDHDIRIVDETLNRTYSCNGSVTGKPGLPDSENDIGNWEAYPGYLRSADWDSDGDGLPNWWEKAHGMDTLSVTGDFTEANADPDGNGFTNLEEYLHWMSAPHYFLDGTGNIQIDLADLTRGFTSSPVFEITATIHGQSALQSNSSLLDFSMDEEGLASVEYRVTDAEGSSYTGIIGFYSGNIPADSLFTYYYRLTRTGKDTIQVDSVNTLIEGPTEGVENLELINNISFCYPNPVKDLLTIDLVEIGDAEINILDMYGRILYSGYKTGEIHLLPMEAYNPGIYIIRAFSGKQKVYTSRIIKY